MESSDSLPVVEEDLAEEKAKPKEPSDERPALRAKAMAALRQTRQKANGNLEKTRMTVEAVDDECSKRPGDSRIMQTLRLDPKKVLESFVDPNTTSSDSGEAAGGS